MSFSVDDCEEAMKNANIDDNALVRMFHQCDDANELVDRAVECNDARALKLLIAEKFDLFFDVQFVSDRGNLLHLAFEFAGFRIVDMLLAAGLVEAESEFGAPPWHFAAGNSDESVMAHLIATGCDVNAVDAQQFSLAHRAAENTNEKVLAMLIAAGADVSSSKRCCRANYAVFIMRP
jgi:ankyrin repeat protein